MAPLKTAVVPSHDQTNKNKGLDLEISISYFLLVRFFGFLVITRDHGGYGGRHLVEMNATGLPELSKPFRTSENLTKKIRSMCVFEFENDYFHLSVFGPNSGLLDISS